MVYVTWNSQGGVNLQYIRQILNETNPDVLCLQECGNLRKMKSFEGWDNLPQPPNPAGSLTSIFQDQGTIYTCVYWQNQQWVQGSLAIMCKPAVMVPLGVLQAAPPNFPVNNLRNLPYITLKDLNAGAAITVFTIHSPPVWNDPPVTIQQTCNWNYAQIPNMANIAQGNPQGPNWVCIGDFNADPTVNGFIQPPVGTAIVNNPNPTQQGGGILDYALTNVANFNFVEGLGIGGSDHYPQVFQWG